MLKNLVVLFIGSGRSPVVWALSVCLCHCVLLWAPRAFIPLYSVISLSDNTLRVFTVWNGSQVSVLGTVISVPCRYPKRLVAKETQGLVLFRRVVMAFQGDKRTNSDGEMLKSKK